MAESQTNRGVANTQILSECIQKEWRERFIGHAHTVNQKLKNAWDWNSSRRKAELSSDALSKVRGDRVRGGRNYYQLSLLWRYGVVGMQE